ncbi:MAG: hypothetical protein Kow0070_21290 [Anaerolineales bacterium]
MSREHSRYRWFVVVVFFFFMLLHQTDKLMIGSLQVQITNDFGISNTQWGLVNSGALIVATILYPIWGYLYDRFARAKLLSLASFVWGATTWLNALARNFGVFLATRASTGIDDSSYPGLYTLVADYFGPNLRGKVYGLLQLAQPIGYLVGSLTRPIRELKGFQRITLQPGETCRVSFILHEEDLAFTRADGSFGVEPGNFHVWIAPDGASGLRGGFRL